jgi:tripeptide aminopeptidase
MRRWAGRKAATTGNTEVDGSGVVALFSELAAIPSPTGEERAVADRVMSYLHELGIDAREDEAGRRRGTSAGNILAWVDPVGKADGQPVFLCAHLDTVPPDGPIEPVVSAGVIRNGADTILGADNKASVAVMLEATRRIVTERRPHAGIQLLFLVAEEAGSHGALELDPAALRARIGFVYDLAGPVGDVVIAAPYHHSVNVVFRGKAAHAGIDPENGRSAITAAARAIALTPIGRVDRQTTANIGLVSGGTARNVVPDRCEFAAEVRSHDQDRLMAILDEIRERCETSAAEGGCAVEVRSYETYPGYRLGPDEPAVRLAQAALMNIGVSPRFIETNGGADANVLNGLGLACVNLANGMAHIHSPVEEIATDDLERMVRVSLNLVHGAHALR